MSLKLVVPQNYAHYIFREYDFISAEVNIIPTKQINSELLDDVEFLTLQPITFENLSEVLEQLVYWRDNLPPILPRHPPLIEFGNPYVSEPLYIREEMHSVYPYTEFVNHSSALVSKSFSFIGEFNKVFVKFNMEKELLDLIQRDNSIEDNEIVLSIIGLPESNGLPLDITKSMLSSLTSSLLEGDLLSSVFSAESKYPDYERILTYTYNTKLEDLLEIIHYAKPLILKQNINYKFEDFKSFGSPVTISYKSTIKSGKDEINDSSIPDSFYNNHMMNVLSDSDIYGLENITTTLNLNLKSDIKDYTYTSTDPRFTNVLFKYKLEKYKDDLINLVDNLNNKYSRSNSLSSIPIAVINDKRIRSFKVEGDTSSGLKYSTLISYFGINERINLGGMSIKYRPAHLLSRGTYDKYKLPTDPAYEELKDLYYSTKESATNVTYYCYNPKGPLFEVYQVPNLKKISSIEVLERFNMITFESEDIISGGVTNTREYLTTLKTLSTANQSDRIVRYEFPSDIESRNSFLSHIKKQGENTGFIWSVDSTDELETMYLLHNEAK